jgi:hypothetical protein
MGLFVIVSYIYIRCLQLLLDFIFLLMPTKPVQSYNKLFTYASMYLGIQFLYIDYHKYLVLNLEMYFIISKI